MFLFARYNVGFPFEDRYIDCRRRTTGWSTATKEKGRDTDRGRERKSEGSKSAHGCCLFCGHLLPAIPEGWPCPSVFGERLSFDKPHGDRSMLRDHFICGLGRRFFTANSRSPLFLHFSRLSKHRNFRNNRQLSDYRIIFDEEMIGLMLTLLLFLKSKFLETSAVYSDFLKKIL